ncbi:MAG TPA: AraC family transcriptional regulator [Methylomirabilota bacterium]|nr:AraC family transcriptional regulator [Methylomirabilota bacterium]
MPAADNLAWRGRRLAVSNGVRREGGGPGRLAAGAEGFAPEPARLVGHVAAARARPEPRLLVFSPDLTALATVSVMLRRRMVVDAAPSPLAALALLAAHPPTIAVVDASTSLAAAVSLLHAISTRHPDLPVVVIASEEACLTRVGGVATSALHTVVPAPLRTKTILRGIDVTLAGAGGQAGVTPVLHPTTMAAVEHIREHYARPIRGEQVARAVGASASHLAHLFRGDLGLSIRQYVTGLRVEIARHLIAESGDKLERIAELTGFSDASHLSRIFTHLVGQRPGRYRRGGQLPAGPPPER